MKTTVEVPDELLQRVREICAEQNRTFRSVLEEALRRLIEEHVARQAHGVIRDASYGHGGMNPEFAEGGWERIRDVIYEGRGA